MYTYKRNIVIKKLNIDIIQHGTVVTNFFH